MKGTSDCATGAWLYDTLAPKFQSKKEQMQEVTEVVAPGRRYWLNTLNGSSPGGGGVNVGGWEV